MADDILTDHKRQGSKLIPPFVAAVGPMNYMSWVNDIFPEIIWSAFLNHSYDYQKGASLTLDFVKCAQDIVDNTSNEHFTAISSFSIMSEDQKKKFVEYLHDNNSLNLYLASLAPLVSFYPACPLSFMFAKSESLIKKTESNLSTITKVVNSLFDKTSKEATYLECNIFYATVVTGKISYANKELVPNLHEIEDYPLTDKSQYEASRVRNTIQALFAPWLKENKFAFKWPNYFWNNGLQISECSKYE